MNNDKTGGAAFPYVETGDCGGVRPVPAAPAVAFNISHNVDAKADSAERIEDNSAAPAVAVPAIDIETILDASTATMCQCLRSRLLAAEVRRLQAENERLRENAKIISELEQLAARSNNDLLVENERLKSLSSIPPDCRTCANRGQVNGLSQESYCESCVHQGRGWRKNHFVDVSEMVDNATQNNCKKFLTIV